MKKRVHVLIHGDVINVGFRGWTMRNAKELGLTGWVKNVYPEVRQLADRRADYKTVEAVFEGEKEKVEEMIELCHQGPEVAWVDKVDVKWEEATLEFDGFNIIL
ncbi:acylphosphatase [Candidatus Gottesmanbacteria bacterium]|nr:acylphosphatase [Candidatus Gottesmanbacteria bacterium]